MANHGRLQKLGAAAGSELKDLCAAAAEIRDRYWGKTISYSRKVFIPLTTMCRNACGYCVFMKRPNQAGAKYMTPDEVLDVARRGSWVQRGPVLAWREARASLP